MECLEAVPVRYRRYLMRQSDGTDESILAAIESLAGSVRENIAVLDAALPEIEPSSDLAVALSAVRTIFIDQLSRLRRKEAKGAVWAAEEGNFLSRLDEFFDRHRKTYQEQIEGSLSAFTTLGIDCDAAVFMDMNLASAHDELVELSGTVGAGELQSSVATWSDEWSGGCESVADNVTDGEFK